MKTRFLQNISASALVKLAFVWLVVGTAVCLTFSQGTVTSGNNRWTPVQSYDGKTPPPLTLPEAYEIALDRLGEVTNRFYCLTASCLEMTNRGYTGWTFCFANTNAQRARIDVYFDKATHLSPQSEEVLFKKN
ncbi:MAG TPA: hypothetical protein VFZ59_00370 [Verrucomicrobiae bacterium]|nr:hypothetical protein [Verrucomicrobiae bacterium]